MRNFAILCAVVLFGASTAWAQSPTDIIRDAVFSEVEKRIIGEHYGVDVQQRAPDTTMPTWAVKTDEGDDDDDRDDDENDDRDKGKKDKGKKAKKDKGKGKSKSLPPGLAKRDSLPPGLQKQLEKNGRLPAGLAKRDLPADLAAQLPARSPDQEVSVVEDDVVLTDKATGVILDVIKDVVRGGGASKTSSPSPDGTLAPPGPQSPDVVPQSSPIDTLIKSIFGGN